MPPGERKLIVLVVGCRNLPPHAATGTNDAYVSLRIKEDYEQIIERQEATDPFDFVSNLNLDSAAFAVSTIAPGGADVSVNAGSLNRKHTVMRSTRSVSIAATGESSQSEVFGSFSEHSVNELSSVPKKQPTRRGSMDRRRSSAAAVLSQLPREYVSQYLPGQKYQTKLVRSTSSPEYGELFVFGNLPIPLRRRSSSIMINNSLSGGSNPLVVRAESTDKGKINQRFSIHVNIYDNTSVKGLGELICSCVVPLDELAQGKRATLWVPLETHQCASLLSPKQEDLFTMFDGESDAEKQLKRDILARRNKPHIGLVLEPVNFGVLQESVRNESPQEAILRALNEELYDVFSDEFIGKIREIVGRAEELGMEGFNKDEMGLMMQELYFFVGVSVPTDVALEEEVLYLFSLFDKTADDIVNISELCGVIKMSSMVNQLGQRWRRGRHVSKIFTPSTIAGCLWEPQKVPPPLEYAGYRKPDGSVHPKSAVPQKIPGCLPHVIKPIVNLYNALYGDEENRQAVLLEETRRLQAEEDARLKEAEDRRARGEPPLDDTIPMLHNHSGLKKNPQHTQEREERSLAQLFAPPIVRSPNDQDLPSLTFDNISKCIVEFSELKHCQANTVVLHGCRIVGGRYVDCVLESCIVTGGAEIVGARSLRCCEISRVRINNSNPVNCRVAWSHLRECELAAQNTLTDCDISNGTMVIHCYLKECNVDSTAKDGGANVYDLCRMLPAPKVPIGDQLLL
jgi:hypothetical protein